MLTLSVFRCNYCRFSDQCVQCADKRRTQFKAQQSGVSLLETLVVMLLLGCAIVFLLPNLHQSRQAQYRKQAETALQNLDLALRNYKARTGTYVGAAGTPAEPKEQGAPRIYAAEVPGGGAETHYRLRINQANKQGFEIRAVPVGRQINDPCGTLTLTSGGVRGMLNAQEGVLRAHCWFEPG